MMITQTIDWTFEPHEYQERVIEFISVNGGRDDARWIPISSKINIYGNKIEYERYLTQTDDNSGKEKVILFPPDEECSILRRETKTLDMIIQPQEFNL